MRTGTLVLLVTMLICGCKKKTDGDKPDMEISNKPVLLFPSQNSACTTSTIVSATQSIISFTWKQVDNASNYDVIIKNMTTGTSIIHNTPVPMLELTLSRDTPYSWYVISKPVKTPLESQSDIWNFYNPGPGEIYYTPFPADQNSPIGQYVTALNGSIQLRWRGSDPDNDIVNYDVYFGTSISPEIYKSNVTDMFLNNIKVISGTTYYWKIITKDEHGNSSSSALFQFRVV